MQQLIIYSKTEHLFYRVYPSLRNFPKIEKWGVAKDIKECFLDILKYMSLANSVKSKRRVYLAEAEGHLHHLTTLWKFSFTRRWISKEFYQQVDELMTEIKKMLSGWIKSSSS